MGHVVKKGRRKGVFSFSYRPFYISVGECIKICFMLGPGGSSRLVEKYKEVRI